MARWIKNHVSRHKNPSLHFTRTNVGNSWLTSTTLLYISVPLISVPLISVPLISVSSHISSLYTNRRIVHGKIIRSFLNYPHLVTVPSSAPASVTRSTYPLPLPAPNKLSRWNSEQKIIRLCVNMLIKTKEFIYLGRVGGVIRSELCRTIFYSGEAMRRFFLCISV